MSATSYDNWKDLVNAVQEGLNSVLKKDVAPVAKNILSEHIKTDIYDAYTPKENGWVKKVRGKQVRATYERRNDLIKEVYAGFENSHTLFVTSGAEANTPVLGKFREHTGAFLELLESGNMGLWRGGFPRPAVSRAVADMKTNTKLEAAINDGISSYDKFSYKQTLCR